MSSVVVTATREHHLTCTECGNGFVYVNERKQNQGSKPEVCSAACRRARKARWARKHYHERSGREARLALYRKQRPLATKTCRFCEVEFTQTNLSQMYCSPRCSRRYKQISRYGLNGSDFDALLEQQGNACAACGERFTTKPQVDHCHRTGAVRALLCFSCNAGIGMAGDDVARVEQWVRYLREHPT